MLTTFGSCGVHCAPSYGVQSRVKVVRAVMGRAVFEPCDTPPCTLVQLSPFVEVTTQDCTFITFQKTPAVPFFCTSFGETFQVMICGWGGGLQAPLVQPQRQGSVVTSHSMSVRRTLPSASHSARGVQRFARHWFWYQMVPAGQTQAVPFHVWPAGHWAEMQVLVTGSRRVPAGQVLGLLRTHLFCAVSRWKPTEQVVSGTQAPVVTSKR